MTTIGVFSDQIELLRNIIDNSITLSPLPKDIEAIEYALIQNECNVMAAWIDDQEVEGIISHINQIPFFQYMPVIIISPGNVHDDQKAHFYEIGVDDFISLDDPLEARIRLESLLKRSVNFVNQAFRDALTNTYNRRYLLMLLEYMCNRNKDHSTPLSLAFLDLDRFKLINDTYGHDVGDLALQGMANLIQRNLASTDVLARFGGEEYVLVMETGLEGAQNRLNHILSECNTVPIVEVDDIRLLVTFSGGICEYSSEMSLDQFIKSADEAAYKAKQRGRNRVVVVKRAKDLRHILLIGQTDKYQVIQNEIERVSIVNSDVHNHDELNRVLNDVDFDVVLIDLEYTGSSGWDLVSQIRNQGYNPTFVVVSGKGLRQQFMLRCEQLDIKHYLSRPFTQNALTMVLNDILDEYQ